MYLELEVIDLSPEKKCEQMINGTENLGNMLGGKPS
jgi:hypothetical protein